MKTSIEQQRIVPRRWLRVGAQTAIAAAGLAAIVGSGGGGGLGGFDCPPELCPAYVWVNVEPERATVQVGQDVVFEARVNVYGSLPSPRYAWCRLPAGGSTCEPIAGADGPSLTVARVNLADDQSTYRVRVTAGSSSMSSAALLMVSASPPAVFGDGDFVPGAWTSTGFVGTPPRTPSSAFTVARPADGGNPGAFLSVTYGPLATGASMRVVHAAQAAVYDPAQLGAIYTIDFRAECKAIAGYGVRMHLTPMLRQGTRTYFGDLLFQQTCESSAWAFDEGRGSLVANDFQIFEGPACGAAESCPDFSASGAPITFGVITGNEFVDPATAPAHGVDNWQVSVWRR